MSLASAAALVVFSVSQDHARLARRDHIEPAHKIGLPRVRAESAECMNRRFHRDFFAKNLHLFLAIHKPSAQRSLTLITDDQHVCVRLPEIRPEMMKDTAAVAHACPGHDQTRAAHIVDCARIVCGRRRFHRLQICAEWTIANERFHFVVEKLHVPGVNVRCFDSHRAIEEDRKRLYFSGAKHFREQQRDQLRATDSESRHKHLAAAIDCVDHDSLELRDRLCKRAMVPAAIS